MRYIRNISKIGLGKGHVGTEMNELADEWANKARKGATL